MRTKLFAATATIVRKHIMESGEDVPTERYSHTTRSGLFMTEREAVAYTQAQVDQYRDRDDPTKWNFQNIVTVTADVSPHVIEMDDCEEFKPLFTMTLRRTVIYEIEVEDIEADNEDDAAEVVERMHENGDFGNEWRDAYEDSEEMEVLRIEEQD